MDGLNKQMTENKVIEILCRWLQNQGWNIESRCIDHQHGIDILATKGTNKLVVEAKGSRGNPDSHVTVRNKFNSGQIKTHFGKAIVKVFEERNKEPGITVAIAQPDDEQLNKCLIDAIPEVIKAGIKLYWISDNGQVREQ